jgi:ATP-dependent DNA helicase RecG
MHGFTELWEKLLAGDESVLIEAKRGERVGGSMLETISAFANEPGRGGGYLLLGVDRSPEALNLFPAEGAHPYEVAGVPNPDQIQADLATQCRELFNVSVRPQITVEQVNGKSVLMVFVPEAQPHDKPVYIRSKGPEKGGFRRIGSTDQHLTDEDIALFYQLRTHRTFDETAVSGTTIDDLDPAALAEYRRIRSRVSPSAAELRMSDEELVYALTGSTREGDSMVPTIAGIMLFGAPAALRRHFPMTRVDYIRVPGREWVPNPEERYQAVELRGPLLTLIPRVIATVLDDIPSAFALTEDGIHRQDVPVVPRTVIREAIVNALMHRSYRQRQPVQIIRYANRIEIRNPGHSLVPDERLGEPGSLSRNEKIAAVLHEVGLAETKGTGVRSMREAMERANLTLPLFESDREKDSFTVTLLVHHLLGPEDLEWLAHFHDCGLNEEEARALLVAREVGAINNAAYRDINHVDTLTASAHLRRLRDLELLEQRGKSSATYYVPTARLLNPLGNGLLGKSNPTGNGLLVGSNPPSNGLLVELNPSGKELLGDFPDLPEPLRQAIQELGRRASPYDVMQVILRLCAWRSLKTQEVAAILGRRTLNWVRDNYLSPMVRGGELEYLYPDNPAHPQQAYRTTAKGNERISE